MYVALCVSFDALGADIKHTGVSAPTSAHIAAGASPYVDDSHDMADGASHSSPSGSPPLGPERDTAFDRLFDLSSLPPSQEQAFSMYINSGPWATSSAEAQHRHPHQHEPPLQHQYVDWESLGLSSPFSHVHADVGFANGLSPGLSSSGDSGSGIFPPSGNHRHEQRF